MDVSERDFGAAVVERSHTLPVLVDFWAAWCGPCRTLSPILERAAQARSGRIELVKVDVDANPNLARAFGIQGIPAVKAFRDGRVVAEFVGAQPQAAVERFMDSLLPSDAEMLVGRGDEESLRRALELEPGLAAAAVPLARILLARGEHEAALEVLEPVRGSFAADGMAARIRLQNAARPDLGERFAELDAGQYEPALDGLIQAVRSEREARDEIRKVVVGVLDELGADDPRAVRARSKLAAALY